MAENKEKIFKIMFVCTGNTCRSAMAEGLMNKMLEDRKITNIKAYSAGLHASKGEYSPDEAIITMQKNYDVDILHHQSINVKEVNLDEMDLILCATRAQLTTLEYRYPELKHKIFTMKEYAYGPDLENKDIEDPWGYPIKIYEECAEEISETLKQIINKIEEFL